MSRQFLVINSIVFIRFDWKNCCLLFYCYVISACVIFSYSALVFVFAYCIEIATSSYYEEKFQIRRDKQNASGKIKIESVKDVIYLIIYLSGKANQNSLHQLSE